MSLRSKLMKYGVSAVLRLGALLARRELLAAIAVAGMRALARAQIRVKKITKTEQLDELGAAWQQGFPSKKQVPITAIDAQTRTVHAEIHTPCPLRGTGDVQACHRLMAYDREIAAQAGGQFFVLRSQAEPGVTVCQVALRFQGEPSADLIEAHRRK